jgi:hypothetical protein
MKYYPSVGRRSSEFMALKPIIFQTPEVAKLLKASRFTLNRLMIRCKIETSVGVRGGRGSRLLFTVEDVAKLAVAYWLFRSGLRTQAIRQALEDKQLKQLCNSLAGVEAFEQVGTRLGFLVTWRPAKGRDPSQEVKLERDFAGVQRILESVLQYGFVVIPIGRLVRDLGATLLKCYEE